MNNTQNKLRWAGIFLSLGLTSKDQLATMKALCCLRQISVAEADDETALSLFTVALDGFTFMDVHHWRADCMVQIASIYHKRGEPVKPVELWKTAQCVNTYPPCNFIIVPPSSRPVQGKHPEAASSSLPLPLWNTASGLSSHQHPCFNTIHDHTHPKPLFKLHITDPFQEPTSQAISPSTTASVQRSSQANSVTWIDVRLAEVAEAVSERDKKQLQQFAQMNVPVGEPEEMKIVDIDEDPVQKGPG
ncbi:hypothetical protein C8J57DRAFT_1215056 [Mycena rebaudengoi]|nr:hypothetical protein C8J57DRAFT_1215056 [Mycena rebaudengoi]